MAEPLRRLGTAFSFPYDGSELHWGTGGLGPPAGVRVRALPRNNALPALESVVVVTSGPGRLEGKRC